MKSSTETSFRKKVSEVLDIPGTRVSVQNAQLLTSSGSSTLDFFLGGGLAVGTICLIEEDRFASYSDLVLKYFLAEGITWNHSIFLACGEKDPGVFLNELPATKAFESSTSFESSVDKESSDFLKIAWRYRNIKEDNKVESHNVGFDLSKPMPEEILKRCSLSTWDPCCASADHPHPFLSKPFDDLYHRVRDEIAAKGLKTSNQKPANILRIGIKSIASPLWSCNSEDFCRFLYSLKALLRSSYAVALLTLPSFLNTDAVLLSKVHQICDTVINLESFVGSHKQSNPLFKDFDGLLHIKKLPVLNTFMLQNIITADLAFKLKKRGLLIERVHLPPDLEDSSEDPSCCSSGFSKKLDF